MRTKAFSELTSDEFAIFARFAIEHGDPLLFPTPDRLAEVLGGGLFEGGEGFLILWERGFPKAAVGCIVRDIERNGTAYLAGIMVKPEDVSLFPLVLEEAIAYIDRHKPRTVMLGLPTGFGYLEPLVLHSRFRRSDRALILSWKEKEASAAEPRTRDLRVVLERLCEKNAHEFRAIQNRAFRDNVNAAFLTAEEVAEVLARGGKSLLSKNAGVTGYAGIATFGGEPIGLFEIEIRGTTGWIETIGIDPDYRGRGFGRALLSELMERFRGKVGRVELLVMESNQNAVRLYLSSGFTLNRVRSTWYALGHGPAR